MKLKRIISVILTVMMLASVIPASTLTSSALSATKYETAAHELDSKYRYDGNDLGATYTPEATTFKVWAPTATECKLNLYNAGTEEEEGGKDAISTTPLNFDEATGIWSVTMQGDLKNKYYTYSITAKSIATDEVTTKETADVYSVATGANGQRSMVCDLDSTDPEGWDQDKHVLTEEQADASIWEIHVKDFSYSPSSGVSAEHRGKFLGFTEEGTTLNGEGDISTCIDYLKDLGVTYIHLNPIYDFGSIDETGSDTQFNWGYDPMNYNVPEGSYSTNPYDGNVRINECKQMIQALHKAGIGVIMDVVYNHTYNTNTSFQACVPDYYYRKKADGTFSSGSGCGNDTASERAMYRNFMVQSVKYWAEEYHIDGFRFDLMGLHDTATMNKIRESLDTISEDMLMYGEGWSMSTTSDLVDCDGNAVKMCSQGSTKIIDSRIAMFNDQFRDGMKGSFSSGAAKGFIQGSVVGNCKGVKYGIRANTVGSASNWKAYSPAQCVNYMSCHDNNTLYDKLGMSIRGYKKGAAQFRDRDNYLVAINKFAETIAATSQGMHFFLAGEEMARSKDGDENSYKSAATENMIDWNDILKNQDLVSYYKGMMDIRQAFSPFTTDNINIGKNQYIFSSSLTTEEEAFSYIISNSVKGEWKKLAVAVNCNTTKSAEVSLAGDAAVTENTEWVVIANTEEAGLSAIETFKGEKVTVPPSSALVMVEKSTFDACAIKSDSSKVTVVNKDSETGKTISKQVLYGKIGSKYITQADETLALEYTVDGVTGEATGTFGETDKVVTYAYSKYVPASLKNTLTGDTELTVKDATIIQKHAAKLKTMTDEQLAKADYNYDGKVDVSDATLVQKKITHCDIGSINKLTVKYLSKTTKKEVAPANVYRVQAGQSGTYAPIDVVGYKYDSNSASTETPEVTVNYTFSNQLLIFYYTEDNYDVTLHVKHSGALTWTPTLWAWHDAGDVYDAWPGEKMTKDAEGDWYTATFAIPNGMNYSLIINNGGATQTKDYTGFSAPEMWAVIDDSAVATGGSYLSFYTSNPDVS